MQPHASSIYVTCPGCADRTLVVRDARGVTCAACGFDYRALATEGPRFESFLVDRMREGPIGQLGAVAIVQWTTTRPLPEAMAWVRGLASAHGIELPTSADPALFVRRVLTAVAVGVALLVLLGVVAALRG